MSVACFVKPPAAPLTASPPGQAAAVDGLLARIGNTPLVRLQRVVEGLIPEGVEIWAKCEWFNPGGSVKDRPVLSMVLDAEERGVLQPGDTLIEASSGNTAIAFGLIAAARGYQMLVCLPGNANAERRATLSAYGVQIIDTDALEGTDGAIRKARELVAAHPDRYVYLDQYNNPANWWAHYRTTGPEIWRQTGGRITHFVAGLGTAGTFCGTARFLREQADIHCIAVQPDAPFHGLEGLKHMETAMVPGIYDPDLAHAHLFAPTEASLALVRRLAQEEGLLVGPSGGAAAWAAIEVARELDHGVVVTVFPDSGARYLSEAHIFRSAG